MKNIFIYLEYIQGIWGLALRWQSHLTSDLQVYSVLSRKRCFSYLEKRPESLFKLVFSCTNLFLAEIHKAACAQSGLQLLRALQKGRFCNNLADMYNVCGGLLRLLSVRLCVLQRHQLPTKLWNEEKSKGFRCFRKQNGRWISWKVKKLDSQQKRLLQVCGSIWVASSVVCSSLQGQFAGAAAAGVKTVPSQKDPCSRKSY